MPALEAARPRDYQILQAFDRLQDTGAVARELGLKEGTVRGSLSRARGSLRMQSADAPMPANERVSLIEYLTRHKVKRDLPTFTAGAPLVGDHIVLGDVHLPLTDWNQLQLIGDFALKHMKKGQRRLVLAGDLFNFDCLSRYDNLVPPVSLMSELDAGDAALAYFCDVFDKVYYYTGNHDVRLLRALQGAIDTNRFGQLISRHLDSGKFSMTIQGQAEIISGGVRWRTTHQANYSKITGRVADMLAAKYQCCIVSLHQHHVGKIMDSSGRYSLIDGGGAFNPELMAYVGLFDSTNAAMANGFTYIRSGTGHLLTPYKSYTDWSMWRMEKQAAPVAEAVAARHARMYGGAIA